MSARQEKLCVTCGRPFAWRRKWARDWERVRFCGEGCRRQRPGRVDERLERAILELVAARRTDSICPSEAARRVSPDSWRPLMERARRAARRLAHRGRIEITQRGRPVEPGGFRGPIRLRLPR